MTRDSRNEVRGGKIGSNLSPIPSNPREFQLNPQMFMTIFGVLKLAEFEGWLRGGRSIFLLLL
jgi:hypothetical protein